MLRCEQARVLADCNHGLSRLAHISHSRDGPMKCVHAMKEHCVLGAQALALLWCALTAMARAVSYLPVALITIAIRGVVGSHAADGRARFYEGTVMHRRKAPAENSFRYPVRMALIDLDQPPSWFKNAPGDTMSAEEARKLAGTTGPVQLLTNPVSAGYVQNPISVYYCYSEDGSELERCVAEVTNTPWGERVSFCFRPGREEVPKALHVSPLMDMLNTWVIRATRPGDRLFVSVAATHPQHGSYFIATLDAVVSSAPHLPNETASLRTLAKYGFQPQRIAFWIYWQALVLLYKGVPFYGPPNPTSYQRQAEQRSQHPRTGGGACFLWRPAQEWPWNASKGCC